MNRTLEFRLTLSALLASASLFLLSGCTSVSVPAGLESTASSSQPTPSATSSQTSQAEAELTPEEEATSVASEEESQPGSAAQSVKFSIGGGCQESYESIGYYGIFEEFDDDCYLIVEVFPPEPRRFAELQYFDSTWTMESSGSTDSQGILYLDVDPYCDDGLWCDGIWEYRVSVEAEEDQPADRSVTFELDFIPWE